MDEILKPESNGRCVYCNYIIALNRRISPSGSHAKREW